MHVDPTGGTARGLSPASLGNPLFRQAYGIRYNYVAGAMYKGIASAELVIALGRAGLLGFFGSGGLDLERIDAALHSIRAALAPDQAYGMNLLASPQDPALEMATVELYLRHGVCRVEASAFLQVTAALVRYRLSGLTRGADGRVIQAHLLIAKVSRPEVAEAFMRPAPAHLVSQALAEGWISAEQAELGAELPLAQDICVEADSGGHTDRGNPYVLMPAMQTLRARVMAEQDYREAIRIGSAGGIGTPEAAVAAFMLGADFIVTGSINQCTVEAGTSSAVKDMLQDMAIQDTAYAPAGDMFELGAQVQVLKKGSFFAARGQKLHALYLRHGGLDEIDERTRVTIEDKYFRRSFAAVWEETRAYLARRHPAQLAAVEASPKQKMALVFRWYFIHSARLAMSGSEDQKVDYQVHCGPALGAFNSWVKGTPLEPWRARPVAAVAEHLMQATAAMLGARLAAQQAALTASS